MGFEQGRRKAKRLHSTSLNYTPSTEGENLMEGNIWMTIGKSLDLANARIIRRRGM
jgi:hypothetical protein